MGKGATIMTTQNEKKNYEEKEKKDKSAVEGFDPPLPCASCTK